MLHSDLPARKGHVFPKTFSATSFNSILPLTAFHLFRMLQKNLEPKERRNPEKREFCNPSTSICVPQFLNRQPSGLTGWNQPLLWLRLLRSCC
ncbi:hypothetical protein AVEN_184059-1 [Araneus ventricosus]|uniref:Uncharacterized protein n=1 Tax=Araneus ventricosus TaxID=182803 RepID=A0A4Y2D057_ARAVE|nr:hypothetical protein AVEN_184059-1 [Araneus ventricosus]